MSKNSPTYLVFYIDRETITQREVIREFVNSVNNMLLQKDANTIAFFIPTDGEERIECINPTIVPEVEMDRINKIVEDLKKSFDINQTPTPKECKCADDGICKCETK